MTPGRRHCANPIGAKSKKEQNSASEPFHAHVKLLTALIQLLCAEAAQEEIVNPDVSDFRFPKMERKTLNSKLTPISTHYRQRRNRERRADVTKIEKYPVENFG